MAFDSGNCVINGKYGTMWLDTDQVAECYGIQAKAELDKEEIAMCGGRAKDFKVKGTKYKGSLKLHKVNSRMAIKIGEAIRKGKDVRFEVISLLADPDAFGSERVKLKGVSFDDLTIVDWESDTVGKVECPFTFTDFEYMDKIEV